MLGERGGLEAAKSAKASISSSPSSLVSSIKKLSWSQRQHHLQQQQQQQQQQIVMFPPPPQFYHHHQGLQQPQFMLPAPSRMAAPSPYDPYCWGHSHPHHHHYLPVDVQYSHVTAIMAATMEYYHHVCPNPAAAAAAAAAAVAAVSLPPSPPSASSSSSCSGSRAKRRKVSSDEAGASTKMLLRSRGSIYKPYDIQEDEEESSAGGSVTGGAAAPVSGVGPGSMEESERCREGASARKRKYGGRLPSADSASTSAAASEAMAKQRQAAVAAARQQQLQRRKTTERDLLPEVLSHIFSFLDVQSLGRAARVSMRWRDAAYRRYIWRDVEARLHLSPPEVPEPRRRGQEVKQCPLYPSLARRGITQVQVLSLSTRAEEKPNKRRGPPQHPPLLQGLVHGVPAMRSLNLSGCFNLTDSALEAAFRHDAPALTVLDLSLCKDVSDDSLGRIAAHCRSLEELDLGGCSRITNDGVLFVAAGLKKLRRLNLRSCRQVSDTGIGYLSGVASASEYEVQYIGGGGGVKTRKSALSPSSGGKVVEIGIPGLEELGLQDCQKITDESLRHVSSGLQTLKSINLSFCVSITDTGVKSLARLRMLRHLNLRSCDNVSDLGMGFLCDEGRGEEEAERSLLTLDVSFCAGVTDAGVRLLAAGLPGLTGLSLTTCAVGDEGMRRVAQRMARLARLSIGQCAAVTDAGLKALSEGASAQAQKLEELDLYGCPKVGREAVERMRKVPGVRKVNCDL